MIDRRHTLPVVRQCQLLALPRSSVYYAPQPVPPADLALMRQLDELHLEHPFAGSRMLRDLLRLRGVVVGRKRVATLMRRMGIEALYRPPRTTQPHPAHRVFPYLLRDLAITRPNQVWCSDITLNLMGVAGCSRSTRPEQPEHHGRHRVCCGVDRAPGLTHAPWTRSDGGQDPFWMSLYKQG